MPHTSSIPESHPLHRMFAGLVEHAFAARLGVADTGVTDYLTGLLTRFVHMDGVFPMRNIGGRRLEEVAEMLVEAYFPEPLTAQQRRAVIHKQVGDFTLFWTGVYPESLGRLRSSLRKDSLVDYISQGKKSYRLAAEAEQREEPAEARVLGRISEEFEYCVYGLGLVRREWERTAGPDTARRLMQ
mgnify:CR=1 FL=1